MPAAVRVEDREGGLRVLTLSHPGRRNALDAGALAALDAALAPAPHVRAVLLRGEGGTFCAGYDLNTLGLPEGEDVLPDDPVMAVMARVEAHPAPTVALVQGWAFGAGFDLAASCDFRVGEAGAVLCMPPARLGIVYAPEGLSRAARLVGPQRAKRLFLTGMRLPAEDAHAWGLLDALAPAGQGEAAALALCAELLGNAPLALAGMKEAFRRLHRHELDAADVADLRALRRQAFASADAAEGRAAFLAKRAPRFGGR